MIRLKCALVFVVLFLASFEALPQLQRELWTPYLDQVPVGPLVFTENKTQWHPNVLYRAEFGEGAVFLEQQCFTFIFTEPIAHTHGGPYAHGEIPNRIRRHVYRQTFSGSNIDAVLETQHTLSSYQNYFIGNDRSKWSSKVKSHKKITYRDLYDGIDMQVYGHQYGVKYDFLVKPGADPGQIIMDFTGTDEIYLNEGDLIIKTSLNSVTEQHPLAFQEIDGKTIEVPCFMRLMGKQLSFEFPSGYNDGQLLIIDPTMIFATFSGSFTDNWGSTATFDEDGNAYAGGIVNNTKGSYRYTVGAFDTTYNGSAWDMAITKYDSSGSAQIFATYLGGNNVEFTSSMIVNKDNELIVYGTTGSDDWPTTVGAFDSTFNGGPLASVTGGVTMSTGSDMVLSRFSEDGSQLLASTYVGGNNTDGINNSGGGSLEFNYADGARGEVIVDSWGNIYVASCTRSTDFPVSPLALQNSLNGSLDAVVFKLDQNLTTMIFSTYYGGFSEDAAYSMKLKEKSNGNGDVVGIYVTGGTNSTDLLVTGGYQGAYGGGQADGFVALFNEDATFLDAATYYGSPVYDQTYMLELDTRGNVFVVGQTLATDTTFIFNAGYSVSNGKQFISKFTPLLDSLLMSTAIGSGVSVQPNFAPTAFLVDACNNVYVSGWGGTTGGSVTRTFGLPVTPDAYQSTTDGSDFYLFVAKPDVDSILYATFFGSPTVAEHVDGGSSRFDKKGKVYQSICSDCSPTSDPSITTPGAAFTTNPISPNWCTNLIFKFDLQINVIVTSFKLNKTVGCTPLTVDFTNDSEYPGVPQFYWDIGNGDTATTQDFTYTFTQPGFYKVLLVVRDTLSCNKVDSVLHNVIVLGDTNYAFPDTTICEFGSVQIGVNASIDSGITYLWTPSTGLSNPAIPNPVASPTTTTLYTLYIFGGACNDTITQLIKVDPDSLVIVSSSDTITCAGDTIRLTSLGAGSYDWTPNISLSCSTCYTTLAYPLVPTTYYISARSLDGCSQANDTIFVDVIDPLGVGGPDEMICLGDSVQLSASGGSDYYWATNNSTLSCNNCPNPYAFPQKHTDYVVKVTDINQCVVLDTIHVHFNPLPSVEAGPNRRIPSGASTVLLGATQGAAQYYWVPASYLDDSTKLQPTATPAVNTTYYLISISDSGCKVLDSVVVELIFPVHVPTGFTPNGDGVNDKIFVIAEGIVSLEEFTIFDRWGVKVFKTTDINEGWDGTYKGEPQVLGVYVYYLKVVLHEDEPTTLRKGLITLIR